jgi:hypothetical protein
MTAQTYTTHTPDSFPEDMTTTVGFGLTERQLIDKLYMSNQKQTPASQQYPAGLNAAMQNNQIMQRNMQNQVANTAGLGNGAQSIYRLQPVQAPFDPNDIPMMQAPYSVVCAMWRAKFNALWVNRDSLTTRDDGWLYAYARIKGEGGFEFAGDGPIWCRLKEGVGE